MSMADKMMQSIVNQSAQGKQPIYDFGLFLSKTISSLSVALSMFITPSQVCFCLKCADFASKSQNNTLRLFSAVWQLSGTQEKVKIKYFSRSMLSFKALFKANLVFKDFSSLPYMRVWMGGPGIH